MRRWLRPCMRSSDSDAHLVTWFESTGSAGVLRWVDQPAVASAHEPLSLDKTIADSAAVVGALVGNDHEFSAVEASYSNGFAPAPGCDDRPDRDVSSLESKVEGLKLDSPIVRVVAELVDQLCM